jgi:hypothetical protein
MTNIKVEECWECPFADGAYLYEWGEYTCSLKTDTDGKFVIKSETKEPPDWCPLRKEDHLVSLEEHWNEAERPAEGEEHSPQCA